MEYKELSQLSYENVSFENLMNGPTLCFNMEFNKEDMAILNNLMSEQDNALVTKGMASLSSE